MIPQLRMTRQAAALTVALVLAAGCSVSLKERAVRQVQALDTVLSQVDDTEQRLYDSGTVPALTEAKHKEFSAVLVTAFDAVERTATALRAWRAGDPVPNDVQAILDAAKEALAVLESVLPEASSVLGYVRTWLETAIALQQIFSGGQP